MCVTSSSAKLSETRILSFRLSEQKHLLAYTNKVENLSILPNSMILPVPGRLTEADFIDTSAYPGFMTEMEHMLTPRSRGMTLGMTKGGGDSMRRSIKHFQSGMYEVFIADPNPFRGTGPMSGKSKIAERLVGKKHPIIEALEVLEPINRPVVQERLLNFYDRYYPGWSLVVCVFGAGKAMESQPIMFTYEPLEEWKDKTFFPGVDSHDGGAP